MPLKTIFVVTCFSAVLLGLLGCSDLPTTQPEFPDFRSETRFINATGSSADVMYEPTTAAGLSQSVTVASAEASGYLDIPAGTRQMKLPADPDTASISIGADAKTTVVVLPRTSTNQRRFRAYQERRTFDVLPDTAQVRFIIAVLDTGSASSNYSIVFASDTTVVSGAENLAFQGNSGYVSVAPGTYTFGVVNDEAPDVILVMTSAITVNDGQRYTVVAMGNAGSVSASTFQDD